MVDKLYDQLLKELEKARSPVLSYLQPGISRPIIDKSLIENNIEVSIPDEVYSLYQWRNGVTEDAINSMSSGEVELFRLAIFDSLGISIQNYQGPDLQNYTWAKGLFPLFDNGLGDYYLIDTKEGSDTYKMIMYHPASNPYIQGIASVFDSLDTCLATVAECYRRKAYYYLPDSPYLEIDPKLEKNLWEEMNPKSEYYKILKNS